MGWFAWTLVGLLAVTAVVIVRELLAPRRRGVDPDAARNARAVGESRATEHGTGLDPILRPGGGPGPG